LVLGGLILMPVCLAVFFICWSFSSDQKLREAIAEAEQPLHDTKPKASHAFLLRQHALNHSGDSKRGEELFRMLRPASCATCHRARGQGGDVGPDLSLIGGKFDRAHLVESILEPSRQIVEGYRSTILALSDGRLMTGL